jgi:hypothetical protein
MGDDADITEEWAQRIMCAVEGVPFESSKLHIYIKLIIDMPRKRKVLVLVNPFSG